SDSQYIFGQSKRKPRTRSRVNQKIKGRSQSVTGVFYTRLVSLYGDVPLLTSETTLEASRTLTKSQAAEVWDFIHSELTEAADLLPLVQEEKGRITKGAALSVQARAMLYAHRYQEAAI